MIYHSIGVKPSFWLNNHPRLDLRFDEGYWEGEERLRNHNVESDLILTGFPEHIHYQEIPYSLKLVSLPNRDTYHM